METKWIEYKNKKIFYSDYRGAKSEEELLQILKQASEQISNHPEKLLAMANFSDIYATRNFLNEIKKAGKEIFKEKITKTAVIGIIGIKKILYNAYLTFSNDKSTKLFEDEITAKNWLIQ